MEKISKKKGKKGAKQVEDEPTSRRTNSSAKVFQNLQKIVTEDYKRKEDKKQAKAGGKFTTNQHGSGQSTKKYML